MNTLAEKLLNGWPILVFIIGLLISWGVWSFQTGSVSKEEFNALETRVIVIETEIIHPSMSADIMQMKTDIAILKQASKDMSETVRRIENHQYGDKQ